MMKTAHALWAAVCLMVAVMAFLAGRLTAGTPAEQTPSAVSARRQAEGADNEETQDPAERIQELQKKLADAEKHSGQLQKDKSDLQAKLADLEQAYRTSEATLNDLRRRAEELEWQTKSAAPPQSGSAP